MAERFEDREYRKQNREQLDRAREAACKWHRSDEGREWHREHGKRTMSQRERFTLQCSECGNSFDAIWAGRAKYCSRACWQRAAYKGRYMDSERTCARCGEGFVANRYRATRYCSRLCANRDRKR